MWKHRDALLNPLYGALGFLAMPNVWIFQVLFTLISPVIDLMFIWAFLSAAVERWEHPEEYAVANLNYTFYYYALFLVVDALAAAFAFLLEKREQKSLLWWLFLQRFCYRQVMYYVMIRSVLTAVKGALVGGVNWNEGRQSNSEDRSLDSLLVFASHKCFEGLPTSMLLHDCSISGFTRNYFTQRRIRPFPPFMRRFLPDARLDRISQLFIEANAFIHELLISIVAVRTIP
jgi:hypothetical protein